MIVKRFYDDSVRAAAAAGVVNLVGGLGQWRSSGHPVISGA
jgi:hypothetical protein